MLKNWKKWDWAYAVKCIALYAFWIGFEAWFCWMIVSHL